MKYNDNTATKQNTTWMFRMKSVARRDLEMRDAMFIAVLMSRAVIH